MKKDKYENGATEQRHFRKGTTRNMTISNRKHLKQDNSERDKYEKEPSGNTIIKKDNVKQDKTEKTKKSEQEHLFLSKIIIWIRTKLNTSNGTEQF